MNKKERDKAENKIALFDKIDEDLKCLNSALADSDSWNINISGYMVASYIHGERKEAFTNKIFGLVNDEIKYLYKEQEDI